MWQFISLNSTKTERLRTPENGWKTVLLCLLKPEYVPAPLRNPSRRTQVFLVSLAAYRNALSCITSTATMSLFRIQVSTAEPGDQR